MTICGAFKQPRAAVLCGMVLLVVSPALAKNPSPGAVEAFNRGVEQFNARQYPQAQAFFDKAVERDPQFAEAFYARAGCKHYLQDPQGSLSDLNEAIQVKPNYWDAYALRGAVWYEQEQWDPALQDFDVVLRHRPHDAQALLGRGVIALRQEHFETAQHDLRLFLKLRPDDPLAPRLRKLLNSLADDFRESAQASEEGAAESRPVGTPVRKTVSATSQRLAEDVFMNSHQLSNTYGRKVMRGENAQAVGDIRSNSTVPAPDAPSRGDVQIVEPNNGR